MGRLVVGLAGASGVRYGIRLLEVLQAREDIETHLVISGGARRTIELETDMESADVEALADEVHELGNIAASLSSGSFHTMGMVVVPCSMKTLSGIANSYSANLLLRAADVTLKERRRLVLLPPGDPAASRARQAHRAGDRTGCSGHASRSRPVPPPQDHRGRRGPHRESGPRSLRDRQRALPALDRRLRPQTPSAHLLQRLRRPGIGRWGRDAPPENRLTPSDCSSYGSVSRTEFCDAIASDPPAHLRHGPGPPAGTGIVVAQVSAVSRAIQILRAFERDDEYSLTGPGHVAWSQQEHCARDLADAHRESFPEPRS